MGFPYEKVFKEIENSLLAYGSKHLPREQIQSALDRYKTFGERELTDDLCYSLLVDVAFYSGMGAAIVTKRLPIIHEHFADFRKVADFGEEDIDRILADDKMLRHPGKVEACVENAAVIRKIVEQHGSFAAYLTGFDADTSFENLLLLKEELQGRFAYLGDITVYHFLTEMGFPVIKPDRVIARLFQRLGLVDFEKQQLKTVIHGRKFADATSLPVRYVDIVLVAFGQVQSLEFGIDRGICLDEPRCEHCSLNNRCLYFQEQKERADA